MRRWMLLPAVLSAALLLTTAALAGCGEGEDVVPQVDLEVEVGEDVPESGATPKGYLAGVSIEDFSFKPADLTVKVGARVVWTNNDSVTHTVDFDDFSSPRLNKGATFEHTFEEVGTFDYICGLHPDMRGTVTVEEKPAGE